MPDAKEKKRKRAEDGAPRPKKKVAVQTPSSTQPPNSIRVSSIQNPNECPPVLATHPGLCIPNSVKFQAYTKPQPTTTKTKRSKSSNTPASNLLLHSSTHSKLDYTAKEDGPGGRESHLKHYIGVFDPKTGQLSVVEAKKMAVRGVVRSQQPAEEDLDQRGISKTTMELRNDLGQAFGTKKAKKALAAITENAIAPEKAVALAGGNPAKLNAASKAMMESIQEVTVSMASKEDLQAAADAAKPVPPGNFDAEEIQDVYTPEILIGGDTLNAIPIKDWQDAIKKGVNTKVPSAFVASRLTPVGQGPNAIQRLRALRYLEFLIRFIKGARPTKVRGAKRVPPPDKLKELLEPAPEPVVQNIRRKFSESGEIRKFHTDLMYTYCCALAAILSNYEFETSSIRYDLGLDEKQFGQYFREIGGKTKVAVGAEKGTRVQIAQLALPLEFPKVRYQRPKNR
ncbi:RNA polymerase I associated factor, A49-like protein [Xylariomycetidae sp. FL0641]|nr:RNA polymerase I associated factor, A49-like protein [Xylariomycetidae sp. FL0641]